LLAGWPRAQPLKHRGIGTLDVQDLGAARRPGDQRHGPAGDTERGGHRDERGLGRLAVDGALTDLDDQCPVTLAADPRPSRAGPDSHGDPHRTSVP